jgi:hypothetical protein
VELTGDTLQGWLHQESPHQAFVLGSYILEKAALEEVILAAAAVQDEFPERAPWNQEKTLSFAVSSSITLHSENLILCQLAEKKCLQSLPPILHSRT